MKLDESIPVLSLTEPPALMNSINEAYAEGTRSIHVTLIVAGQLISGGVLSDTLIVYVQLDEFPHASVAVQVTKVEP